VLYGILDKSSNFEFSWQAQLLSWLCFVLSDFGGGGRECCCRPTAGVHQAVRVVQKGDKTEAVGTKFQFWVADGGAHLFLSLLKQTESNMGGKFLGIPRGCY
jgi:hypothetical protein